MSNNQKTKLQEELKFLDEEKQRISNLVSTLPSLETRRHEVIKQLNPYYAKKQTPHR